MIRLTEIIELPEQEIQIRPIYVPSDIVIRVWFGKTIVDYSTSSYTVCESPEEVARMVLEYKLLMEQYRACQYNHQLEDAGYVQNDLMELAGLENTKTGGTTE